MGNPSDRLPPDLSSDQISEFTLSLGLPTPTAVEPPKIAAAFDSMHIIHYTKDEATKVLE